MQASHIEPNSTEAMSSPPPLTGLPQAQMTGSMFIADQANACCQAEIASINKPYDQHRETPGQRQKSVVGLNVLTADLWLEWRRSCEVGRLASSTMCCRGPLLRAGGRWLTGGSQAQCGAGRVHGGRA